MTEPIDDDGPQPPSLTPTPITENLPANHFAHAHDYLARRGITPELIDRLGIKITSAADWYTSVYGGRSSDERIAIKFTHYDTNKKEIEWHSVKFVKPKQNQTLSFGAQLEDTRPTRTSPKGQMVHGYLCPLNNWRNLKKGQRIFICESVIKAANVSLLGYHAIGLNGVAAFSSAKRKVDLIGELKDLPWQRLDLKPVIMYDSDYAKYDITRAYETLANKLSILCNAPQPVYLPLEPPNDDEHWGFDDARAAKGDKWAKEFLAGDGLPIVLDNVRQALHDLNNEVMVIRDLSSVVETDTGTIMSEGKFRLVNYANRIEYSIEDKPVPIAKAWMQWPHRNEVESVEYMPGQTGVHNNKFNLWKGMGVEPKEGDVGPFLDLLDNNIRSDEERRYLLQWCAYPVQNLGAKLMTSVVLVGVQGIGKSLFGQALGSIYGENYHEVDRSDLTGAYNADWAQSQFVVVEELHGEQKSDRSFMAKLKKIITSDVFRIKQKYIPEYKVRNHVNFMLTTNDADALAFEGGDRRFFVAHFEPRVDYYRDSGYWNRFLVWLRSDGPAALYHYLLDVDMEGFDPGAPAPETAYKEVMEEAASSGPEAWVKELWEHPDSVLPSNRALWTSRELATLYYEGDLRGGPGAAKAFSNYLLRRGFIQANGNTNVGNRKLGKAKYWVVRNRHDEAWQDHGVCVEHLLQFQTELPTEKY